MANDDEKAVSGHEETLAAKAAKHAAVAAAAAADAAKHADVAAAAAAEAAKHAAEAAAEAAKQAEEEVSDDEDVDSEAEYNARMSAVEYMLAYKALPQFEIDLLLEEPVERVPFADTELFKTMAANPSVTQDDIDAAALEHEERLDKRVRFVEWVRQEYEAKGYVAVSDDYIARRIELEAFSKKLWEQGFVDSEEDDNDFNKEQEAGEEIA
ncbi:hypothetical protein EJB05_55236, partial [Eragrostis curvula]